MGNQLPDIIPEADWKITKKEYLMGRDAQYPLRDYEHKNLHKLLMACNRFREVYGVPMKVSSGYRPGIFNKQAGGARVSAHMSCEACDFLDTDGKLAAFCLANLFVLENCGLYLENPAHTKGWVHLQTRPPRSGSRVFNP